MNTFEKVKASVNEDNVVQLELKINVGILGEHSFFGNYKTIEMALIEAMFNQYKNGDEKGARETLEEIKKLAFWQMIGVSEGSIIIKGGKVYGFKDTVDLDESLIQKCKEDKTSHA